MAKYQYASCRALGHHWRTGFVSNRPDVGSRMIQVDMICVDCGLLRSDLFSEQTGALYGRSYHYPDQYRTERTPKDYWRKSIARELKQQAKQNIQIAQEQRKNVRRRGGSS